MEQTSQEKIQSYVDEATRYVKMTAAGKKWSDVEALFVDMFNRIDNEPEEVKAGVAEQAIVNMDKAIGMVGKMNILAYKAIAAIAKMVLPDDMALSKNNIQKVESYAGSKIPPRVAFYFSAIKGLPDVDNKNPHAVLENMRTAYKKFKI